MISTGSLPEASLSVSAVLDTFLKLDEKKQEAIRAKVEVAVNPAVAVEERQEAEKAILAVLGEEAVRKSRTRPVTREERLSREQLALRAQMDEQERGFAESLSRLMAERQMTQAELARRTGVGQSAVSMLLAANAGRSRTLGKLAEALGVSVEELWPGKLGL